MTHLRTLAIFVIGFALSLGLTSDPGYAQNQPDGLNIVAPERGFSSVRRSYSSMDEVFSRTGAIRSIAQVRRVQIGSSKSQLVNAVGQPVSANRDGSWNFNLSLDYPQSHRLICQYRVYFDDAEQVASTVWRRPQCADVITGRTN